MGDDEPGLVTRDDVTRAFAAAGETLKPRLDLTIADPESPIEVVYEAPQELKNRVGPFGVVVLEDEDSATRQVVSIRVALAGAPNVVVERLKNVVILIYPQVRPDRRMRLLAVLQSL